ncbi:hypothetical protein [Bradyrhizobium sp. NC92]|nr:hypothetical protein [Bradyrhizobium sp. NC92]UWU68023.1 hypothetical protein N2602_33605 [Bradyrhizobium sp. NC92]
MKKERITEGRRGLMRGALLIKTPANLAEMLRLWGVGVGLV